MSNYEFDFSSVSPVDQKDIQELERRIGDFQRGKEDTERFRLYRLTRGVYGQRQEGVQMFRLKLPYGRVNSAQLVRIADVSDRYATGNLHITTRQNVQLHYVKLANSPKVWTELAQMNLTAREACGNTVRNFTASPTAGIDPQEPFDVSPYAEASFQYFLRNPICQEMGRKIKIAFSSSEADSAFTYFHDYGFIPKIQTVDGVEQRGFKVLVGGGLGAQAITGVLAYDFLPEDQIIPFMEAGLRVFDRHGEREKRMKARMKFLIQKLGFEAWMELVKQEWKALKNKSVAIDRNLVPEEAPLGQGILPADVKPVDEHWYNEWLRTNTFEQKQKGYFGVYVRIVLGDLPSEKARKLAAIIKDYAADDIRFTVNQGLLLKFIRPEALPFWFNKLHELGLALPGADSTADITACPGTDTCALGVTNSTGLSKILEELIREEYPDMIDEKFFKIKISGCMNACGQHMAANLGFHGSSFKHGELVIPAMQVVLGGGVAPDGRGFIADKIVKVPTKRIPDVVRYVFDDFEKNGLEGEYYNDYFLRLGEKHFYALLKPLADLKTMTQEEYFDWGQDRLYKQEIGVGECAAVILDMVGVILKDAMDKIVAARETLAQSEWSDAIYSSYAAFVIAAKAMLLSKDIKCNTQRGVIDDFQTHFVESGEFTEVANFTELVLQINQYEPEENFANDYFAQAESFVRSVINIREAKLVESNGIDKKVVGDYYRA
jgi:sulfite reductase (ferredoxin)